MGLLIAIEIAIGITAYVMQDQVRIFYFFKKSNNFELNKKINKK